MSTSYSYNTLIKLSNIATTTTSFYVVRIVTPDKTYNIREIFFDINFWIHPKNPAMIALTFEGAVASPFVKSTVLPQQLEIHP